MEPASAVLHYGPKKTSRVIGEISITGNGGLNDYRLEIAYGAGDTFFFADERLRFTRDGGDVPSAQYRSLDRAGQKESALTDDALTDSDATARATRGFLRRVRAFQFHDTSDGTLRFIALVTLLKQPQLPDVICIDEPELGLHPLAVHTLVDLAYEASSQTQIILATQSVPLVDSVKPSDILTVEQVRGTTGIRRHEMVQ